MMTLLFMILMHIIEDFHVQGNMADMKQRCWWMERTASPKYDHDYLAVMLLHGFEWSAFVHIPMIVAYVIANGWTFIDSFQVMLAVSVIANTVIHSIVDDAKANRLKINLVTDQVIHLAQIVATYAVMTLV
jgi:hypothetical protein